MAVSRSLRFQILRRDNHTCRYCGANAPDVKLTVDHVVPEALGGTDKPENLVAACEGCNGGKAAMPPDAAIVASVGEDALRWGRAIRAAAEQMLARHDERAADHDQFESAWLNWGYGEGDKRVTMPLDADWRSSIDRFRAAGLPLSIILDAIPVTMARKNVRDEKRFSYLCGILWNKVTDLQEAAQAMLDGDDEDDDEDGYDPADYTSKEIESLEGRAFQWQYTVGQIFKKWPEKLIKQSRDRAIDLLTNHGFELTDSEVTYRTVLDLIDTIGEVLE